jgi:hypothetical protein
MVETLVSSFHTKLWRTRGIEQGIEQGQRLAQQQTIVSILATRFGTLDNQLETIIPTIMELPIATATPLLLQLSREDLLQRFG